MTLIQLNMILKFKALLEDEHQILEFIIAALYKLAHESYLL